MMQFSSTRLRSIHANVTEHCMRQARGKRVQVDHLLVSRKSNRLELAAVYFVAPLDTETFPEICEAYFTVNGETLKEYDPKHVSWLEYAWEITPSGTLRYLK